MEYYLFASLKCNLGCNYCSVLENTKLEEIPSEPSYSLTNLYDFIIKSQQKFNDSFIDIIFFGGEPTLNYPYIYEVIDYFKANANGYKVRFILHTNGLLLNEIDSNYLKEINYIILSINYEKIPKDRLYNSYFSKIIANSKNIKNRSNTHIICRLTITENVSLYTNVLQVSNFFDSVYWQIENSYKFTDFDKFYANYKFELQLLWDYWFKYFQNGFLLNYIPFTGQIKISHENLNDQFFLCGFNKNCIYIQNNGLCYSCPEEMGNQIYLIGDIWKGIENKESKFDLICENCNYLKNCRGRCGRMHTSFDRSHVNEYCQLNKELFRLFEDNKENINKILIMFPQISKEIENTFFDITEYIP